MAIKPDKRSRCAVYTRKSSEEGLEQEFNSLDAQREACEAYVASQVGEGWQLVKTRYDDGGLSGGTMDRPALQRLLADIEARKVDIVVVYKVDRLTRSLTDFARIVEVFDAQGVSFVSVTQQFNTTTSMGRLTLNMLLSFAQFEREVTGERIRDKIAASKKKGMWMGGFVPLGYDPQDRSLVINKAEAETVRTIFRLYLECGNVRRVKEEADRRAFVTKIRTSKNGRKHGGRPLSRSAIYNLLNNPVYVGRIAHKGASYPGNHDPIIDQEIWDAARAQLAGNAVERRSGNNVAEPSLFAGIIYDARGCRLTPSHAVKNGKRYRYYVSNDLIKNAGDPDADGFRIPAHQIEALVLAALERLLSNKAQFTSLLDFDGLTPARIQAALNKAGQLTPDLRGSPAQRTAPLVRELVERVMVDDDTIELTLSIMGLRRALNLDVPRDGPDSLGAHTITIPATLRRCGRASKLIISDKELAFSQAIPDPALVKAVARAYEWFEQVSSGQAESIEDIARAEGLDRSYVTRVMRLAFLAPDIIEAVLEGRQPPHLTAKGLIHRKHLPTDWHDQRRGLGFVQS